MMVPAHYVFPQLARQSWWRRWLRRAAIVSALSLGALWGLGPAGLASADTVSGTSTAGCVRSATLYTSNLTGLHFLSLSFRLRLYSETTVAYGQFELSNGSTDQGYWWSSRVGAGATGWTEFYDTKTTELLAGSTGTISYKVTVPGYASGSCVQVDQVRVTRTYYNAQQTGQPGGGGVAPSPTPAVPTPTPPAAPTAVPGATFSLSSPCFTVTYYGTSTPVTNCYPAAPAGYCYLQGMPTSLDTDGIYLVACNRATAPPTPTPTPATFCGGHWWCSDVVLPGISTSSSSHNVGLNGLAGWGGNLTLTAGTSYTWGIIHGWTGCFPGAGCSGTFPNTLTTDAGGSTGCTFGASNSRPFQYTDGSAWEWLGNGTTRSQVGGTFTFPVGNTSCGSLSSGQSITYTNLVTGKPQQADIIWEIFIDPVGYVAPTPTPGPSQTILPVTMPPDYWGPGGATQPPIDVNVDVNVSICTVDPTIEACRHYTPAPSNQPATTFRPNPSGVSQGFQQHMDALASGMRAKAPFGYIDQVLTALNEAVDPEYAAGAEDECWCIDLPRWQPEAAGGVVTTTVELPRDNFEQIAPFRGIFAAIVWLYGAILIARQVLAAVQADRGGDA